MGFVFFFFPAQVSTRFDNSNCNYVVIPKWEMLFLNTMSLTRSTWPLNSHHHLVSIHSVKDSTSWPLSLTACKCSALVHKVIMSYCSLNNKYTLSLPEPLLLYSQQTRGMMKTYTHTMRTVSQACIVFTHLCDCLLFYSKETKEWRWCSRSHYVLLILLTLLCLPDISSCVHKTSSGWK